jgi:ABC-type nitrate/sulfonate/bicarbonate transport system substrate-binding protein
MRRLFGVLLAIVFLDTSAHSADKIRVGYPAPVGNFLTLPLAQKRGFFKEEGLDAEIIRIRPPASYAALVNGDIDYFTGIGGAAVAAATRGVPIKVVACFVPTLPFMLIARPEIKSVQELKGKTIMVGGAGASPDLIARMMLKHFGLDPEKDVKLLPGGASDARLAVLKEGLVAATVVGPPFDFLGKKLGLNVLARSHEIFSYPEGGLSAAVKRIKERPDEVKRVIKAGIKANRYIRTEREGTIQFMMEWQRVDKETAAATYESVWKTYNDDGSLPEKGLRLVIDEAKRVGKVEREISLSEVADLSILREAQKELGITGK